jgi:hypothetical protein
MKKIIFILVAITLCIGSCRKTEVAPPVKTPIIDLGKHSTSMGYNDFPRLDNGVLTINVSVTPGSKYSFQLVNINGDEVVGKGLTADATTEIVKLDVTKVPNGFYDVIILNTNGEEIKSPIFIH